MRPQTQTENIAYALAKTFCRGVIVGVHYNRVMPKHFTYEEERTIREFADEKWTHFVGDARVAKSV